MITDVKSFHLVEGRETRIEQVKEMNEEQPRINAYLRVDRADGVGGTAGKSARQRGVSSKTRAPWVKRIAGPHGCRFKRRTGGAGRAL